MTHSVPSKNKSLFPPMEQTIFWAIVLAVTIWLIAVLGTVLAPFITGMAIAYLLNPAVTGLGRWMPRSVAGMIVLSGFVLVVLAIILKLAPVIGRQLNDVVANLPQYIEQFSNWTENFLDKATGRIGADNVQKVRDAAEGQVGAMLAGLQGVLKKIWSGGMAVLDVVTFLVITPVVAFYCLRDWPTITRKVDDLFPRQSATTLRSMMAEFNMRLAGFVRGQLLVCLTLGVFYATALTLAGLHFGLAIGLLAGFLTFIPYLGSIFGFVSSVGVALIQYPDYKMPLVIAGIFFIGQFIEGNVLTPKMVGDRIGLHPVWVIFALMAGGKLFGFTGMLLAVPVAALIGVVVRYGINWYMNSSAYHADSSLRLK